MGEGNKTPVPSSQPSRLDDRQLELFREFLEVQRQDANIKEKELSLRKDELELEKDNQRNSIQYAHAALDAQSIDRREERKSKDWRFLVGTIATFLIVVVLAITAGIGFYAGQGQWAAWILSSLLTLLGGTGIGGFLARRNRAPARQEEDKN